MEEDCEERGPGIHIIKLFALDGEQNYRSSEEALIGERRVLRACV